MSSTEPRPSSTPPPFVFVTGNPGKLAEARRLFGGALESVSVDLPEIQSLAMGEVLAAKGDEAWRRVGRPLVVEETGLEIEAFGGSPERQGPAFPGPLVKWMLEALGAEGMARAAAATARERGLEEVRATARCRLLWTDGERRLEGEGVVPGRLVHPARGDGGFGWDPVFEPEGLGRTYAELSGEAKDRVSHRARAWAELRRRLERS